MLLSTRSLCECVTQRLPEVLAKLSGETPEGDAAALMVSDWDDFRFPVHFGR